jgi:CubicO group peptidase (beta-lactamase class C family)
VAIRDGFIRSMDDKVSDYLPEMKGSAYDDVSIRHLLTMTSGVKWNEDYGDPDPTWRCSTSTGPRKASMRW